MKKILGLDLGVSSIGWALIEEHDSGEKSNILGMGVRIVPLATDEKDEFSKGNRISENQKRTLYRSQRRGLDRYQQRREKLKRILMREGWYPDDFLFQLTHTEVYGLRARAATEKVRSHELGRVLLHLNQRRGYKSSRIDEAEEEGKKISSEEKGYLAEVKNRHKIIQEKGLTIGQYFFECLLEDPHFQIKNQVFPRIAYMDEYDTIMQHQGLPPELVREIRDEIIYYQRPLKSKKNLVSVCQFAGHCNIDKNGAEKWIGPKVAPVSSPVAQACRVWEHINNLRLNTKENNPIHLTLQQKQLLFPLFDSKEKVTLKDIVKALRFEEGSILSNKQLINGIRGNATRIAVKKVLQDKYPELLQFNLPIEKNHSEHLIAADKETGEVWYEGPALKISSALEQEPFYQLWHTIYSIPDIEECKAALERKYSLDPETAKNLARIDFTKAGFSNKSVRAIRQIMPYLMEGVGYSKACELAGYKHTTTLTKAENQDRSLIQELPLLPKNSLRQPVVEKILNQMIHVVNAVQKEYGNPDEIRVELARELRQSQEERNKTYSELKKRELKNNKIREELEAYKIRATRNNIIKYHLFSEIDDTASRVNATCVYCGKIFGFTDAMLGNGIDVEHIIPQQLRFDDSQSNKTLAHRACNLEKGNNTAYDYMSSKSPSEFEAYLERVKEFHERKLFSYTKRNNLLTPAAKLKDSNFITRQLQETRFISKKSIEILTRTCREVHVTTGKITEYLRRIWGWNDVLMRLQLPKYKALGLSKTEQRQGPDGHYYTEEIIPGWSKRKDHRHHAIDALVVACTKQGFIQRLNTLHAKETQDFMYSQTQDARPGAGKILERYIRKNCPFPTHQVELAASKVLVSIKAGKKVATKSLWKAEDKNRGKNRTTGVITPRGPISEESVYGKIKLPEIAKPLKYIFEHPDLIMKQPIREKVLERIALHNGNVKAALKSLNTEPIFLDEDKKVELKHATCYKEEIVIRYQVNNLKIKDLPSIIDPVVREKIRKRFEEYGNDEKKAMQGLQESPIWYNEEKRIPIKKVRCTTGLKAVEPIRKNPTGNPYAFVKPGNNHHMAFYSDSEGNFQPHVCTLWHAVERKKYGFPAVVENPTGMWETILHSGLQYPDAFLEKLPSDGWEFRFSMQQNEMFILGLPEEERKVLLDHLDYTSLSPYLYRVQNFTLFDIYFRHHLETEIDDSENSKMAKNYLRINSLSSLLQKEPFKVKLTYLGKIELP